jgi:hypothetical protein
MPIGALVVRLHTIVITAIVVADALLEQGVNDTAIFTNGLTQLVTAHPVHCNGDMATATSIGRAVSIVNNLFSLVHHIVNLSAPLT